MASDGPCSLPVSAAAGWQGRQQLVGQRRLRAATLLQPLANQGARALVSRPVWKRRNACGFLPGGATQRNHVRQAGDTTALTRNVARRPFRYGSFSSPQVDARRLGTIHCSRGGRGHLSSRVHRRPVLAALAERACKVRPLHVLLLPCRPPVVTLSLALARRNMLAVRFIVARRPPDAPAAAKK